eukprot:gene1514-1672_t
MPLRNKEKCARRRAKIKADQDLWKDRKEKDRITKAKSREAAKSKMSNGEWRGYRVIKNARVQKYRDEKRKQLHADVGDQLLFRNGKSYEQSENISTKVTQEKKSSGKNLSQRNWCWLCKAEKSYESNWFG